MQVTSGFSGREAAIIDLFTATFTASEGAGEGALVGDLACNLMTETPPADIRLFCADDGGRVIGAGVFTRLTYPEDPHSVMLLSPMGVAVDRQRQGVGQALLRHGMAVLRAEGVDVAITYGDPKYYGQVGFTPITERQACPPLPLSMPHGWLGHSLVDQRMPDIQGPSTCVSPLNRADLW